MRSDLPHPPSCSSNPQLVTAQTQILLHLDPKWKNGREKCSWNCSYGCCISHTRWQLHFLWSEAQRHFLHSRTCPKIFPKLRLLLGGISGSLQEMKYKCLLPLLPTACSHLSFLAVKPLMVKVQGRLILREGTPHKAAFLLSTPS